MPCQMAWGNGNLNTELRGVTRGLREIAELLWQQQGITQSPLRKRHQTPLFQQLNRGLCFFIYITILLLKLGKFPAFYIRTGSRTCLLHSQSEYPLVKGHLKSALTGKATHMRSNHYFFFLRTQRSKQIQKYLRIHSSIKTYMKSMAVLTHICSN